MREWLIRKNHFILCLLFPLVFGALPSIAQNKTITGTLLDKQTNEPLIGASVVIKGTSIGTAADFDGKFSLEVSDPNAILVCRFIGYNSLDFPLNGATNVTISLSPDIEVLDEVVVVGYGTMRKSDLTGSLSSVKSKDVTAFTVANPIQALQGRVPGVSITSNTGSPEGNFSIRIRGTNSIRGDNTPLYVIDGIPANASSINNHDIESIEVLKDASATAIYGSRGANGVILITTKKGRTGATSVDYNFEYGIQSQIKKVDMMDATEYAKLYNEQRLIATGKEYFTNDQVASFGKGTDWQSLVFKNAPIQNHNISITGGNEKTKIFASGSLMLKDGLIPTSLYNKYNIRSSIDHAISNFLDLSLIASYTRTDKHIKDSGGDNRGGSIVGAAIASPPTLTPYNDDGSYQDLRLAYPFMSNNIRNPINRINEVSDKTKADLSNVNTAITWKPVKGLSLKSSLGIESLNYRTDNYITSKYLYNASNTSVSSNQQTTIINENIVNYDLTVAKSHRLNFMGGFSYQEYTGTSLGASGTGFLSDAPESHQLGGASSFGTPSTSFTNWTLMSYLGRANYSYKGKYLATASIRADGSSRYSKGDKWGYFPSAALAWRISDEEFLKEVSFLSDLKLRLGWGSTGSTAISPYTTMNMLSQGKAPASGDLYTYYAASTTFPANLKWETTTQWNLGLDLSLLNQRLRVTADYYYKNTTNLLNSVSLPPSTGYSNTIQNIGEMSNRGFELQVDADLIRSKEFLWNASVNFAVNKNRVEKLYEGSDIFGSNINLQYVSGTINLIREGEPLGVFYVYTNDGYDENGQLKYIDFDQDGNLTNEDRSILGNPHPDFTYGINSLIQYKNFEFSFFLQGSQGNDIYNVGEISNYDYGMGLNLKRDVLYSHWSSSNSAEQNTVAKYPKLTANQNLVHSDRFIEDGSYLRLKNIAFAYNLPVQKWGLNRYLKQVQIYVSAQNILTIPAWILKLIHGEEVIRLISG
ncbi:SusC/RagA family TonB-linked outer membrane protein [Massilibacteroides vaginae]|uniref:SusC/RagA family TonB-linked outer membrane protein n=1 Tax=Massilibacteroides vaginae TaxID=1673718 RepID=UPI001C382D26|nr:TonB-dependent receptor [Massilibacteroides vaginae]